MNTAFLQLTAGDYASKLALHTRQFHAACGGDGPAWAKTHNACLLLTHHPAEWLDTDSHQHLDGEITNGGRFAAHLCGHLHAPRRLHIATDGNQPKWLFQGRSLFGLETYGDQQERLHGYAAGRITVGPDQGTLVLWPRGYHRAGPESHLDRDPDQRLPKGQDATDPEVFKLASPCRPGGGSSSGLPERDGRLLAGIVSPAYRTLVDQVRQRVQRRLAKPSLAVLAAAWGSDPVADLDLSISTVELSKQIKGLLHGLHRKTKECLDEWHSLPKDRLAGLKDDCRFLLSELIKLTVDSQASESEIGPVSAAALAPVHLLCNFGGTADVVLCALADLEHLLEKSEDGLNIAADITVHFDDLLPSGEGEARHQELLRKLWVKTMHAPLPGRIDGKYYDQLLARIKLLLERDERRYVLAAPGWREWCAEGDYRKWAEELKLGLVLHESGGCRCLLIEEAMVLEIARSYLALLETL